MFKLILAITKHNNYLKKNLKAKLVFSTFILKHNLFKKAFKSQLTFFAFITYYYHYSKKVL